MSKTFVLSLLMAALAAGQPARLAGPTPGFVYDAGSRELRPIRGIVGSAHLGAALITEANAASVSPDATLAVASRSGTIELVRAFDSGAPVSVPLAQADGDVWFAWSGHDLAALVTASREVLLWRGLDRKTELAATLDVSAVEGGIVGFLFDGECLAIASKGGLYVAKSGQASLVLALDDPSALISVSGDLFVADRARGQIWQVLDYAGSATPLLFAEVPAPVGLQASRRGLLVASAETRTVDTLDFASRIRVATLDLGFLPTRLESLGSQPLALLNVPSPDEPLYVLDSGESLSVYFVPAGREQ